MSNTDYLYKELTEINNKYESTTFVDIDFINLFEIKSININNIKKTITNKYYSLALKYHPDKFINSNESTIEINNISIIVDEIKSGQFLSFITDIYKILINMIIEDKDTLINMIEGNNILEINYGGDHTSLKQHFNNKSIINPNLNPNSTNNLKEVIIEKKINDKELEELINVENIKRDQLKIDNIFLEEDIKSDEFKTVFNNKFETTITNSNTNTNTEILPYNELNTSLKLISNKLSTSISDIKEAFEPIQINRKIKSELITYEELLNKREEENNNFRVAKNFKKVSID